MNLCVQVVKKARKLKNTNLHLMWLKLKLIPTSVRQWFINLTENITENAKAVGKKVEQKALTLLPYIPYNVYNCDVNRYLDFTIYGKYNKVLKFGIAPESVCIDIISDMCTEFQRMQGNQMSMAYNDARNSNVNITIDVIRLHIARLLVPRNYEKAKEIAESIGVRFPFGKPDNRTYLVIDSTVNRLLRKKKENEAHIIRENKNVGSTTKQQYLENIMKLGIGAEIGYKADLSMTLAEFASLININKDKAKQYEQLKHSH